MNDLRDRYVAAVLRATRDDRRVEVEAELRTAIDDAVEARVEEGESPDDAMRKVLTELGDPARLAADYSDRPLWLIGPTHYLAWQRALTKLLVSIPLLAGSANALVRAVMGESGLDAFLAGIWIAFIAAVNVVVWTTLGFVIAERSEDAHRSDVGPFTRWSVDDLPSTTASHRRFSLVQTVGGLVVNATAIAILSSMREAPPVAGIDDAAWMTAVPIFMALLAVSMVFKVVKYRVGGWTSELAVANAFLNLAYAGWWTWLVFGLELVDAEYFAASDWAGWINPTLLCNLAVLVAILGWDSLEGFKGAGRSTASRLSPSGSASH